MCTYADKGERSAAQPNETSQPDEKGSVTVLRLNSYAHLGEFTVPDGIQKASIERFNNKIYILSEKPDKRLAGLWIVQG
ncbi:hypothetical protein ACK6VY_03640 [Proteus mirabilis]|uniref:hypothetical protein n=1 Tax=Proteus mirabilis TaxID=584 RepID=UPI0039B401E5